jgi:hypothetical protein
MTTERIAMFLGRIIDAPTNFDLAMIEAQIVREEPSHERRILLRLLVGMRSRNADRN